MVIRYNGIFEKNATSLPANDTQRETVSKGTRVASKCTTPLLYLDYHTPRSGTAPVKHQLNESSGIHSRRRSSCHADSQHSVSQAMPTSMAEMDIITLKSMPASFA